MGLADRDHDRREGTGAALRDDDRRTSERHVDDDRLRHRDRDGRDRDGRGRDEHLDEARRDDVGRGRDDVGRGGADHADPVVVPTRRSGAAVAALILGVVALLISVVPILGLIGSLLGVIAIVLGAIGIARARRPATKGAGMAATGIVCGILSLVLGAAGLTLFGDAVSDLEGPADDLIEDVERELDDATS